MILVIDVGNTNIKYGVYDGSELKASFMTQAMSNYFCYTAFKSCIGEVDEENPSELYTLFQSQMGELPLQESVQGYIDAFKNIAQSQNIETRVLKEYNIKYNAKLFALRSYSHN